MVSEIFSANPAEGEREWLQDARFSRRHRPPPPFSRFLFSSVAPFPAHSFISSPVMQLYPKFIDAQ